MGKGREEGMAFVQLSSRGYSKAYIAAAKHGMMKDCDSMEKFKQHVGNPSDDDMESRYLLPSDELCDMAYYTQLHAEIRKENDNESAAKVYMMAGRRLQDQLVKQGEWEEPKVARRHAIKSYREDYLD